MKKLIICATLLLLALCSIGALAQEATAPVLVTGGEITGTYSENGSIAIYKGIPFAAPPVGDLRWKAPQPVIPWEGVRECTEWSNSAIQGKQAPFLMFTKEFIIEDTGYSEDCLYLNLWTKDDAQQNKPVIVYIHGGALSSGGASCEVYDGEYMATQDIVFVSINYRVGVLGFLATGELSAESPNGVSGNYGLLDQIAALQWVHDNIALFGGDPSNVTIMGQSAGAMSVNALLRSPLAQGLFSKAFSMSYSDVINAYPALSECEQVGEAAFEGKSLEEMRQMTPEELLAVSFTPTLLKDGYVLTEDPAAAYASGMTDSVPLMLGIVVGDTQLFGPIPFGAPGSLEDYEKAVRSAYGAYAEDLLALYQGTEENYASTYQAFALDTAIAGLNYAASLRSGGTSYVYCFAHVMPGVDGGAFGAFHTSDVPYFLNIFSNERKDLWTDTDYAVGRTLSGYLKNFAANGDPNGDTLPEWLENDEEYTYFRLGAQCERQLLSAEKAELFAKYYAEASQK